MSRSEGQFQARSSNQEKKIDTYPTRESHQLARQTMKQGHPFFRRFAFWGAVLALGVLLSSCIGLWIVNWDSFDAKLRRMQKDVSQLLDKLENGSEHACLPAMLEAQEQVGHLRDQFWKFRRRTEEQEALLRRLYELEKSMNRWVYSMNASVDQDFPLDVRWWKIRDEIRQEQTFWPDHSKPFAFSVSPYLKSVGKGISAGMAWPYFMALRVWEIYRTELQLSGGAAGNLLFYIRYLVFPHKRATLAVPWVLGFGMSSIVFGYGFCWVGMKWNVSVLSFLGVLYLFYTVVFAISLGMLVGGLLV